MRHHAPLRIHLFPWRTGQELLLPELFDTMRCQFGPPKLSIGEFISLDAIDPDVAQNFFCWCTSGADFAEGHCRAGRSEFQNVFS